MPSSGRWPPASVWLASWGGCGYLPWGPGTAGSLGGMAVAWLMVGFLGWPPLCLAAAALTLLLPAVLASGAASRYWQLEDPPQVVIDEALGQWVTLAAAPAGRWSYWLLAFLLFRLFDIWKPFPLRQAERLPGGWGIVADDLLAGLYGAVVLLVVRRLHLGGG